MNEVCESSSRLPTYYIRYEKVLDMEALEESEFFKFKTTNEEGTLAVV